MDKTQIGWFIFVEMVYLSMIIIATLYYLFITIEKIERIEYIDTKLMKNEPFVSIIVPTYNEASNILRCVESLRKQNYSQYEIILSDGGSKDRTVEIARPFVDKVIVDDHVPEGWIGKNWGCHLGVKSASGSILLFTDADTCHYPNSLRKTVGMLLHKNAGMLSLIPYQEIEKWWESIIPIYFIISQLTSGGKKNVNNPKKRTNFVALGQYLLFTRDAYNKIGGHERIKGSIIDDYAFSRLIKIQLNALYFMNSHHLISARMYPDSFKHCWLGFKKSLFAGTKLTPPRRMIITVIFIFSAIFIPIMLVLSAVFSSWIFIGANIFCYFLYLIIIWSYWRERGKHYWLTYIFFPILFFIFIITILGSMFELLIFKKTSWKGRVYTPDLTAGLTGKEILDTKHSKITGIEQITTIDPTQKPLNKDVSVISQITHYSKTSIINNNSYSDMLTKNDKKKK